MGMESQSCIKPAAAQAGPVDKNDLIIEQLKLVNQALSMRGALPPMYFPMRSQAAATGQQLQSQIFEVGNRATVGAKNETAARLYDNFMLNLSILGTPSRKTITSGVLLCFGSNSPQAPQTINDLQEVDRIVFTPDWPVAGSVDDGGYFLNDYAVTTRWFAFSIDVTFNGGEPSLLECEVVFRPRYT